LTGECWVCFLFFKTIAKHAKVKIADCPHWLYIPFDADTTVDADKQMLLGREYCLDVLDFRWVGIHAKNLATSVPYSERGFISFEF